MTTTRPAYDPAAPASQDTRPLAIHLGSSCHECARPATGFIRVKRHKVQHCEHHAAIVELTARRQLGLVA